MKKIILLLIVFIGFSSSSIFAQEAKDSTELASERVLYLIKKSDGNEIFGYIISDDGREILLETKTVGKIFINKADIKEMVVVENKGNQDLAYQEYRNTGPFTTRYYFTTNALPIKKGEDYAMIQLYGPEVHFALTDNFSLGIMATWIASPIALAAKYSFNSNSNTHFSLGSIFGSSGYLFRGQGYGGLHFATLTQGTRKSNISVSAGYGHANLGNNNNFRNYIGEKYIWSTYDTNSPYYIADLDWSAESAIRSKTGYESFYSEKNNDALVLGVGGIAPVGKKASFIFDAMAFIRGRQKPRVVYSDYDITVDYSRYDSNTGSSQYLTETFTIGKGEVVEDGPKQYAATLIIMPSMRFNNSYNKAFQVALAGVINIDFNNNIQTFPVPMVSWLRSF